MMFRKCFFATTTSCALLILSTVMAGAQTGELRGHVKFRQADGTVTPAAGAAIDVYRTDLPGKYPSRTNARGEFIFAGLPYVGTYIIAASMPNAQPAYQNNVKAGRDVDYELVLSPGDGRRLTLDEIREGVAGGGTGGSSAGAQESAADRAKRAEIERRNAAIEGQNRKNTAINAILARTFAAGNQALQAGRYDEAIAQYDEGLAADPDQAALLTNKAIALKQRGVARYNASIGLTDDAAKKAGRDGATRDWRDAFDSASRAVALAKAEPADSASSARLNAARAAQVEAGKLLVRADPSMADTVFKAYEEYIAGEPDEGRKIKARNDAAQMLLDAGLAERAVTEFRKLVNENAYNVDAILGLGMSLFTTGDESRYKEAATYLQQFVKMAPDTHDKKKWARDRLREIEAYLQTIK